MAQVRAIRLCQVDNTLRQQDDVFEYNGPFNGNLEYIDGKPPVVEMAEDQPAEVQAAPKKWKPKAKRVDSAAEGSV